MGVKHTQPYDTSTSQPPNLDSSPVLPNLFSLRHPHRKEFAALYGEHIAILL